MKYLWAVLLVILVCAGNAHAQRSGPGLFTGPNLCADVTGQISGSTYCFDYTSGSLNVWNGAQWVPLSGNLTQSLNTAVGLSVTNLSSATAAQSLYIASNGTGNAFFGIKGTGYSAAGAAPANSAFFSGSGGTNGTFLGSDQSGAGLGLYADGQFAAGALKLDEDVSGNFTASVPGNIVNFVHNGNTSTDIVVSNNNGGPNVQAGFFVQNSSGIIGGFSAIGTGGTGFGAPYLPNEPYLNSDNANGLLIYSAGAVHFAASGAGWAGTLDLTEDGSDNFFFTNSNPAALVRFTGGNPVLQVISTTNTGADLAQFYAQNITQGVAIGWSYIKEIGTCGNCSLGLSSQPGGVLYLQNQAVGSFVQSYGNIYLLQDWHLNAQNNGVVGPSVNAPACSNGTMSGGSTDNAGVVTFGGANGGACTINFGRGWGAPPYCTCSSYNVNTGAAAACGASNTSNTALQMFFQATNGQVLTWHCIGQA